MSEFVGQTSAVRVQRGENGEGSPSYGYAQYTLVIHGHRFGVVYGDWVDGKVTKQTKLG